MTINCYTQADADALKELMDAAGISATCTIIPVDPVNNPDAVVWHFTIDEV